MSAPATIVLRLDALVSAWRWLQAGVYRATFPVIPPSAAWGLVLNLAGIETRGSVAEVVTPIRPDVPSLEIAVGVQQAGQRSVLYQQLHGYPVGRAGAELKARTFGNKYWIAPAKREVLVGLIALVAARGAAEIIGRVTEGLAGRMAAPRYGLPFAGDNQCLFSRIDVVAAHEHARWYAPVAGSDLAPETTPLTTNIDRGDASRTEAPLFALTEQGPCPSRAWVRIGPWSGAALGRGVDASGR